MEDDDKIRIYRVPESELKLLDRISGAFINGLFWVLDKLYKK